MDEKIVKELIDRLIDLSFAEDIGDGDHTTLSSIPADAMGKSKLLINSCAVKKRSVFSAAYHIGANKSVSAETLSY